MYRNSGVKNGTNATTILRLININDLNTMFALLTCSNFSLTLAGSLEPINIFLWLEDTELSVDDYRFKINKRLHVNAELYRPIMIRKKTVN